MALTDEEKQISHTAAKWISKKPNQTTLVADFVDPAKYLPAKNPVIAFMAGSPGAGKTEFVKSFIELDHQGSLGKQQFAVIDPDTVRDYLPGYTGSNSYLFQNAVSIAVDKLFRCVLANRQNAVIDGTFANYKKAHENVEKALAAENKVAIFYIFQHPAVAWDFTQKREAVEGRRIRKEDFFDKFITAQISAQRIKNQFKEKVQLNVILKDYKDTQYNKRVAEVFIDVTDIAEHTKFEYTKESIERFIV